MERTIALAALACGLLTLLPRAAGAQGAAGAGATCPAEIPSNSRDRRALAKDWFSRAETAESAGDPITAVKAYQCSLRLVPHAFTAFNLGRLAERTGDLELALESFNTYLKLAPEAPDRAEIEAKARGLSQRINSLRAEQQPAPAPAPAEPVKPAGPLPDLRPPAPDTGLTQPSPPAGGGGRAVSPAMYAVAAAGVAALVGGIVLNVSARSKMSDCRRRAPDDPSALSACDDAKPRAYGSYALFGAASAAAAAEVVLLLISRRGGEGAATEASAARTGRQFSVAPTPGGAVAGARFRF
jgi:tetratricopeptide (TPR) repeat protein